MIWTILYIVASTCNAINEHFKSWTVQIDHLSSTRPTTSQNRNEFSISTIDIYEVNFPSINQIYNQLEKLKYVHFHQIDHSLRNKTGISNIEDDTELFKCHEDLLQDICTLEYFNQNGALKRMEIYKKKKIGVIQKYSLKGTLIQECIYPIWDSCWFNCARYGDPYVEYQTAINDSIYFLGNQWYENGNKKLVCRNNGIDSTVFFHYYNLQGDLIQSGGFKYSCDDYDFCLWREIGVWKWYNNLNKIIKTEYFTD